MLWTRINRFTAIRLLVALAGAIFLWSSPSSARIAKTDSSIIIDADTGQVVSEHNADAKAYPASLTKMMTLYLTFEALEIGQDQPRPDRPRLASRPEPGPLQAGPRRGADGADARPRPRPDHPVRQ